MTKGKPIVGGTTVTANNLSFFTGSIVASATTGTGIDLPSTDNVAKICATYGQFNWVAVRTWHGHVQHCRRASIFQR